LSTTHCLHGGERVLRAVVQLVQEKPEAVFLLLMLGEIHERGEMLHNITAHIPNRAHVNGGPEHAAILTAVANFRIAVGAALECGFDFRQRLRIGAAKALNFGFGGSP
jgi:hypothetical protein